VTEPEARGWFTTRGVVAFVIGLAIFIALLWRTGPAGILEGILRVGWMFPVIVALGGLRFLARAIAWTLCIEAPLTLGVREAFAAVLAGDALGNATPLGPVVGEPAKAAFVRGTVPAGPALSALAAENAFYTLATAAMIASGMVALLYLVELTAEVRLYSEAAVGLLVLGICAAIGILYTQPRLVSRWMPAFSVRRSLIPVAGLEIAFHALGVLETHLTMSMILPQAPPLHMSFILETASRLITVVFKFVPLQVGVAEGGLAIVTELLGMGPKPGVTFSLVRKVRIITWAVVGAVLVVRRGITPKTLPPRL
jgi:hypothetical protein